ncbi:FAD-dependent oxidoreductase [Mesobacillus foraminis]|uniref:FAD-dependent oxidoreductase n=1 Tax=Mesobacillus foraminis TaxID=279826 RepID=UPI001BE9D5D8|nr:FAD-dependent oxidoreductase [Mesobacillus foraminis]MBT2757603.1 FAD-dependent oxidoreductase [Mesobacillus foraminis]
MRNEKFDAIIVGGGLAGLTAGLELATAKRRVLVLEAEKVVGGRTSSYCDEGMEIESGFHRFIGYYSVLPKVLEKADVNLDDLLMWEEKIHVRIKDKKPLILGLSPVHGFFKMLKGIIGNSDYLSVKDKSSLIPFFISGFKDYLLNPEKLDQVSIKEYAKKHHVSDKAFHYLVVPLSSGIFFLPPDRYSAYVFFGLFAPAIPRFYKMRIGAFLGGMTEVMCQPIADKITSLGSSVRTRHKVGSLIYEKNKIKGVRLEDGQQFQSKCVILATTLFSARQLLQPYFKDHEWFKPMFQLTHMPAVAFQMELTEPALPMDITTFGPFTCWASFAEQSRTTFQKSKGRLSLILSPPEKYLERTPKETMEIVLEEGKKIGIDLTGKVLDYRKVDHLYDFHNLEPGNQALRPEQKTPIKGLILAGDYTKQPYFATMESAAISGVKAAKLAR